MSAIPADSERDRAVEIVARFSGLIHSWQHNEFKEAAQARDELAELGVQVKLVPRSKLRKGEHHAN